MKLEQFTVTLSLSPEQVNQLSGLTRLYNDHLVSEGRCPGYTECSYLERLLSSQLAGLLSDELDYKKRGLAGDVPARNPSPDETGPEEPGADGEEEEPETLVMVCDASGVVREVTLDEAEAMREAAQGIYNGEPPEPDFEPDAPEEESETVSNAEESSDDGERKFYILDWYDGLLDVADTYAETLERFNMAVKRLGVSPESLEIVTLEEMKKRKSQGYEEYRRRTRKKEAALKRGRVKKPSPLDDEVEEEPETVSNAEEAFPAVRHGPLMDDKSDYYFYYLEHGHWPPDDAVLAGADVPCTGDYGLSDCLVVTQSALDFVDAFFVGQEAGT